MRGNCGIRKIPYQKCSGNKADVLAFLWSPSPTQPPTTELVDMPEGSSTVNSAPANILDYLVMAVKRLEPESVEQKAKTISLEKEIQTLKDKYSSSLDLLCEISKASNSTEHGR